MQSVNIFTDTIMTGGSIEWSSVIKNALHNFPVFFESFVIIILKILLWSVGFGEKKKRRKKVGKEITSKLGSIILPFTLFFIFVSFFNLYTTVILCSRKGIVARKTMFPVAENLLRKLEAGGLKLTKRKYYYKLILVDHPKLTNDGFRYSV